MEWLVKEGDRITEDQPVCDVMTDKALVQIPAVYDGVVTNLYYAKGDIAKVHAPLFEMDTDGAAPVVAAPSAPAQLQPLSPLANSWKTLSCLILAKALLSVKLSSG